MFLIVSKRKELRRALGLACAQHMHSNFAHLQVCLGRVFVLGLFPPGTVSKLNGFVLLFSRTIERETSGDSGLNNLCHFNPQTGYQPYPPCGRILV